MGEAGAELLQPPFVLVYTLADELDGSIAIPALLSEMAALPVLNFLRVSCLVWACFPD